MPAPSRTSLDQIVVAGREVLAERGLAGLTMQAVAARVGVKAPSLYKHVSDRDALVRLVSDAAAEALASHVPPGADLRAVAHAAREHAHRHPEEFRLVFGGNASPEALARASEPVLAAARAAVGDANALEAARLVTAWAFGFVTMEMAGAFQLGGEIDEAFAYGLTHLVDSLGAA